MSRPYGGIGKRWVHAWGSNTRCKNGNIYFEGDRIYSYGSHWCIARYVNKPGVNPHVLFNPGHYSSSTTSHHSHVRQALPSWITVFYVTPGNSHEQNREWFLNHIRDATESAAKARTRKLFYQEQAIEAWHDMMAYATFFQLLWPIGEDAKSTLARHRIETGYEEGDPS